MNPKDIPKPNPVVDELGITKLELENHIGGLEISKATGYWNDDDERTLQLMYRIKSILDRIQPVEEKQPEYEPTCPYGCHDCVMDPAYLKRYHDPDMTDEEYGRLLAECKAAYKDSPKECLCCDDEDK